MKILQRKLEIVIIVIGIFANLPRGQTSYLEFLKECGFPFVFAVSDTDGWKLISVTSALIDATVWIGVLLIAIALKRQVHVVKR